MTIFRCEALAASFIEALTKRAQLYAEGKVAKANAAFTRSSVIAAQMMADREARERVFKELTKHPSEDVRISAACYLLPIDEAFAIKVLEVAEQTSIRPENQISALYSIKEWRAGNMGNIRTLA